jgi:hypothetical protein
MARDDAIAYGFRLAWRNVPMAVIFIVLGFLAAGALGYFWEQVEAANVFRRMQ